MIKAHNEVLATEFIVWSLANRRSPWTEDFYDRFDDFTSEFYGEAVTEKRKSTVSGLVFEAHHNFMLDLCDHSMRQVGQAVAKFAPPQYRLQHVADDL